MRSPGQTSVVRFAAALLLAFTIVAYAFLIGLGRWQLDEYSELYKMRVEPFYILERLRWSPRPISEVLYSAYGAAVNHFHHALIAPFLTLLWLILLAAALSTAVQAFIARHASAWPDLLVSLTLVALAVSGGDATEVFYWPAGAVAYIPTLAAMLLLFWQVAAGYLETKRGRVVAAVCLASAAGSSEAGATFVLCYCPLQISLWLVEAYGRQNGRARRPLLWVVTPFVIAAAVLVTVRLNRYRANQFPDVGPAGGHPIASLAASLKEMVFEIIGRAMLARTYHAHPNPRSWFHAGPGLPLAMIAGSHLWMELFLLAGVVLLWSGLERQSVRTVRHLLGLCAALLLASLLVTAAANLHFGTTCCERHELLREVWWEMILVGLGIAAASYMPDLRRRQVARFAPYAPVLLVLAVLSLGFLRPLTRTYREYALLRSARLQESDAGFQSQNDPLLFPLLPMKGIITEEAIPIGVYHPASEITGFSEELYPYYLLRFYGKQTVIIRPMGDARLGASAQASHGD